MNGCHAIKQGSKLEAALTKIKMQFPDSAEGDLAFSVIQQCVKDLFLDNGSLQRQAARYLRGPMFWASEAGVSPGYIRRILKTVGGVVL